MKVLVVLHGMPPQAGRTVVGAGLRAFANGEALRGRGHQILYCTRTEDLTEDAQAEARSRRAQKPLLLTTITGEHPAPGDPRRMRRRLTAVGIAPTAEVPDAPRASLELRGTEHGVTEPGPPGGGPSLGDGLAPVGGPLGAPGNPFSFTEAHELHEVVQRVDPDVVLVEALEEARRLPEGRFSVVLDLYAPRILEQQFQGAEDEREAVRVLDAIQRGDAFVFSNARQKYFHLPLLALAGVDCTREAGVVVPISCPPELLPPLPPEEPTFIAGGVFWPWADLSSGLASLLSILEARDRGLLHLYGGEYGIRSDTSRYRDPRRSLPKDHPRLSFLGMVPIDQLWQDYRRGSVAFDLMRPNPERELNLSFRQVDYLRCGLPIITAPEQVIAADLLDYGAGWVVEPGNTRALRRLVDELLDDPGKIRAASARAQALARDRYSWDATIEPLDRLIRRPGRRGRRETFVARLTRTQGDLWEEHEENQRLRELIDHQRADLDKKTQEIATLNSRIATLMGSVDRLSESLGAVSRFKNDAVAYLQQQTGESIKDLGEAALELERRALDLRKKQNALKRAQAEVTKLKASVAELRTDNEHLEARFVARDREALGAEEQRKRAVDAAQALRDRVAALQQELDKKDAERDAAQARGREERVELGARLEASQKAAATASSEADALRGELEELRATLAATEADAQKKAREVERLRALAERQQAAALRNLESLRAEALERLERAEEAAAGVAEQLRDRLDRAEGEQRRLTGKLAETRHDQASLARDGVRKDEALAEAAREREQLERGFLRTLDRAEGAARELLQRAQDRIGALEGERGALRARLEEVGQRASDAQRELDTKEQALERQREAGARDVAQAEAQAARSEALADRRLQTARRAATEQILELREATEATRLDRDDLRAELDQNRIRLGDLEADLAKKDAALLRAAAEQQGQQDEALASLDRAEARATDLLRRAQDAGARLATERASLKADLDEVRARAQDLERELAAAQVALARQQRTADSAQARAEADALRAEGRAEARLQDALDAAQVRQEELLATAGEARGQRDDLRGRLEQSAGRLADLEADLAKKDAALAELTRSLERGQREATEREAAEATRAQSLLEEVRDRAAALDDQRGALLARTERAEFEAQEAQRSLRAKARALEEGQQDRDRLEAKFLAALEQAEDRALSTVEELRGRSSNSRVLEVEAAGQQSTLESLSQEVGRLTALLEVAQFEATALQQELAKKTAEIEEAQGERDAAWAEGERQRQDLEARLLASEARRSEGDAELERACFELEAARQDTLKKAQELALALSQRDAAQAEVLAAQGTIEALSSKPRGKKKAPAKKERRARPRASDAPDTSAN